MKLPRLKIFGFSISYVMAGFLLGLAVLLGSWGIEFIIEEDIPFSLKGIAMIHQNPIVFIVDASPVILAYISYILSRIIGKQEDALNEIIQQQKEEVAQLSAFSMEIGNGNFSVVPDETVKQTDLGRVLIKMKDQ